MLRHLILPVALISMGFGLAACDEETEIETPEGEVEVEAEDGEIEVEKE